jgi:hypothetical protein
VSSSSHFFHSFVPVHVVYSQARFKATINRSGNYKGDDIWDILTYSSPLTRLKIICTATLSTPVYLYYPIYPTRKVHLHCPLAMPSTPFSTESYFQTQKPPAGLDERTERMRAFVDRWKAVEGKRVVLVTVRYIIHIAGRR